MRQDHQAKPDHRGLLRRKSTSPSSSPTVSFMIPVQQQQQQDDDSSSSSTSTSASNTTQQQLAAEQQDGSSSSSMVGDHLPLVEEESSSSSSLSTTDTIQIHLERLFTRAGLSIALSVQLYLIVLAVFTLPQAFTGIGTTTSDSTTTTAAAAASTSEGSTLSSRELLSSVGGGLRGSKINLYRDTNFESLAESAVSFSSKSDLQEAVEAWTSDPQHAILDYGPISHWNVSAVDDLSVLFKDKQHFSEDLNLWNVSNCKNFSFMFAGATRFNENLNNWKVSKGIDFRGMFDSATAFNGDVSGWKLSSAVDLNYMMRNARSFNGDVTSWLSEPSSPGIRIASSERRGLSFHALQTMKSMFEGAVSFEGRGLRYWDTKLVRHFGSMFHGTNNLSPKLKLCWNIHKEANVVGMFDSSDGNHIGCSSEDGSK